MPRVDKRTTLDILQTLDTYLEKYERKFPIYLMGGSALISKKQMPPHTKVCGL